LVELWWIMSWPYWIGIFQSFAPKTKGCDQTHFGSLQARSQYLVMIAGKLW
jgi:hypothetical protein